jgi:hypothetical protein
VSCGRGARTLRISRAVGGADTLLISFSNIESKVERLGSAKPNFSAPTQICSLSTDRNYSIMYSYPMSKY